MNEDNYVEWLVKRKAPAYALPLKIVMGILCVVSVLFAMQTIVGMLIMFALWIGTYFIFLRLNVEYEYLFAEGGLTIDCIDVYKRQQQGHVFRGRSPGGALSADSHRRLSPFRQGSELFPGAACHRGGERVSFDAAFPAFGKKYHYCHGESHLQAGLPRS